MITTRKSPIALAAWFALMVPGYGSAQVADEAMSLQPAHQITTRSLVVSGQTERVRQGLLQAMDSHPEVLGMLAAKESAGYQAEAARYARFPRLMLAGGSGSTDAEVAGKRDYNVFSVNARMTLLDGGVIGARSDAAKATEEASAAAVLATRQKVALDALTAYLQVQRFFHKREAAERAMQSLDELVRLERRRADLGATGENDIRLAQSRRATFAAKRHEFDAQLADARAKFETYFGFLPDAATLPALTLPEHWKVPDTLEQAIQSAEANSAELAEARARVESAKATVRQYEGARFPAVDVVWTKTHDPRGVVYADSTRTGVELNWNFGNGFELQLRVKTALAEVANQESKYEAARLNLVQLTSTAWGQARAGQEKADELAVAMSEAASVLQGRRRLLEFGRETLVQVLDAQVEYETQVLDFIDAVIDQRVNELRVARVMGYMNEQNWGTGWVGQLFAAQSVDDIFDLIHRGARARGRDGGAAVRPAPSVAAEDMGGLRLQPSYALWRLP
jgi:adhesin transport system outer membrane protein